MRPIALVIVCLGCLVGCSQPNTPDEKTKSKGKTMDVVVRYYLNDSLLHYVSVSLVDSFHLDQGTLPYTMAPLDTLGTDATFWSNPLGQLYHFDRQLYQCVPPSSVQVLTLRRQPGEGRYCYCLRFTRNKAPISSTGLAILAAQDVYTSQRYWSYPAVTDINKHVLPDELLGELLHVQQCLKATITYQ